MTTGFLRVNLQTGGETIDFDRRLLNYIGLLLMSYEDGETEIDEDVDFQLEWPLWKLAKEILVEFDKRYGTLIGPSSVRSLSKTSALQDVQLYDLYRMLRVMYHYDCSLMATLLMETIVTRLLPLNENQLTLANPLLGRKPSLGITNTETRLTEINAGYNTVRELLMLAFTYYIRTFDLLDSLDNHYLPRVTNLLSSGESHTIVLTESGLLVKGKNKSGELGLGGVDSPSDRWYSLESPAPPISLWSGANHTMLLTTDGLYGFGSNKLGQIGYENQRRTGLALFEPRKIANLPQVLSVACGISHSLILTAEHVYGCGRNEYGELSRALDPQVRIPMPITLDETIIAVACGDRFSLFLGRSGAVYHCGLSLSGIPVNTRHPNKVTMPKEAPPIMAIAAGARHALFLDKKGDVYVWGANEHGQLGLRSQSSWITTVTRHPSLTNIASIIASRGSSFFITDRGELYGCGANEMNQLGIGATTSDVLEPVKNTNVSNVISVACERSTTNMLTCDGLYTTSLLVRAPQKERIVRLTERTICKRPVVREIGSIHCHVCGKIDTSSSFHLHKETQRIVCSSVCNASYTQFRVPI